MGTRQATSSTIALNISPRLLLGMVAFIALTVVLWPLGGLQAITDPNELHQSEIAAKRSAADASEDGVVRKIGASIAVHRPKFPFVARFLDQWYNCEAARKSIDVYIVFWGDQDSALFKKGMKQLHPRVAEDSWIAVVTEVPAHALEPSGVQSQIIAAWKKWYGIAYMMDLNDPPVYGAALDSELLLYNTSDCGAGSEWYKLFQRVSALEASKLWPAARVNEVAKYNFGEFSQTGREYDADILEETATFIGAFENQTACRGLKTPGCREIKRQLDNVLFSWWTDLPYMNLKVAQRMLLSVRKSPVTKIPNEEKLGSWCKYVHQIPFPRFEHIPYQQWCCLHEGYHFDDVTDVTGYAVWGSYLEDPKPTNGYGSARLADLHPLWLPADANMRIQEGKVPPMSAVDPPLLHIHVDHFPEYYGAVESLLAWKRFCLAVGANCDYLNFP